jgi:hypothetical protein
MKMREEAPQPSSLRKHRVLAAAELARASSIVHTVAGAFVRLRASLLFLVAIVVQVVVLYIAGELVDLYVSAVELWAELARKHLELTL